MMILKNAYRLGLIMCFLTGNLVASSQPDEYFDTLPINQKLKNVSLKNWVSSASTLQDGMIESIAFIKGSKHDYTGHSVGELSNLDKDRIAYLESMIKRLSVLQEKSLSDVFMNPVYQTGLEKSHIADIHSILNAGDIYRGAHGAVFIALEFPFKPTFGNTELMRDKIFFENCPSQLYHNELKAVIPYASRRCLENHLNYVSIHVNHRQINTQPTGEAFSYTLHALPQLNLERVKRLSREMLWHYVGPYWHGADPVTPEIAHDVMLRLNGKCMDIMYEAVDNSKKNELIKLQNTIRMIEGALKLPELYEQAFIDAQGIRFSRMSELRGKK